MFTLPSWCALQVSLSWISLLQSIAAGGFTGFMSGLLGVGGGFIMIPLLTLMGIPIHTAVGTCLVFVTCSSLAGLVQHLRQGTVDPVVALTMALPAALCVNVSARFSSVLPPAMLHIAFGFLLLAVMLMYQLSPAARVSSSLQETPPMLSPRWYLLERQRTILGQPLRYTFHVPKAVLSGMGTGLLAGFFGIGGGVFLLPLLVIVLRFPLRMTAGTSLAIFLPPAIVGSVTHWHLGNVDIGLGIPLVLAGMLGSQSGARYVVRLPGVLLKRLFLFLVASAALYMLLKGLSEAYGGAA